MASLTLIRSLVREALLLELRNVGGESPPATSKYFARPVGDGYVLYYDVAPNGRPQAIPGTIGEYYDSVYSGGAKSVSGQDFKLTPEQIAKAEELVSLGLYQKIEKTTDYPDIEFKSSNRPRGTPSAEWKSVDEVPKKYFYYSAKKPGSDFLLVDTDKKLVSLDASWTGRESRRGGTTPTKDSSKTYVMPSGDVAFVINTLGLQKLFKHLMTVDQRVTPDYKIISPDDKFEGKTIGAAAEGTRSTDIALGGTPGKLIVYHGTSTKRWPEIEKKGMLPGKFETPYADQIPGYSVKNLYFTMDPHTAENYATRAAIWDKAAALILKVEIPDISKIVPDEDAMSWFNLKREYTLKRTPGEKSDYSGKWDPATGDYPRVPYEREDQPIGRNQHVKNVFGFLKMANQTKAYGKYESEAPEAGPEYVKDDEYNALLQDIEQGMAGFLTKSLRGETFAYKGWIPPKFVKKWKEYPRTAYPQSVGSGRGKGTEYEDTRQKVLKKVKRFDKNESLVRSLVRSLLRESSSPPQGFASSTTHSVGWIDPRGLYHYDPNKRDHGEWAAWEVSRNPEMMSDLIERLEAMAGSGPDFSKMSQEEIMANFTELMMAPTRLVTLPAGRSIEDLYYSSAQSEVRSIATKILLEKGWGKVSNAYSMECWRPTRAIVNAWLDLGMQAGSDPERYHNIFDNKKSLVEGDWQDIERFMKGLP